MGQPRGGVIWSGGEVNRSLRGPALRPSHLPERIAGAFGVPERRRKIGRKSSGQEVLRLGQRCEQRDEDAA